MRPPRRAMVLAAGFGSRLAPLTLDCPKALVPLRGRPMLQRCLERLWEWGVRDVAVNVHHLAPEIVRMLPELTPEGMRVGISFEDRILGTGGGLKRMEWFVGEEPLWVVNADVDMDLDPTPILRRFGREHPLAALWMVRDAGPRTVRVEEGRIIDFRAGGLTFSGLQLVSPRLWRFLPAEETFRSVIPAYEQAMAAGEKVLGVTVPGSRWADVGTPEQLLAAEGGSVVFAGARVGSGIRLDRAVVGPGTRLSGRHRVSGLVVSPVRALGPEAGQRFPNVGAVEILPVRGSDRAFFRLFDAAGSRILIRRGEQRPENRRLVAHTRFLTDRGIRVPEILAVRQGGRELEVEDCGRVHLLDRLREGNGRRNLGDMRRVLELTASLHALRPPPAPRLEPPFSPDLIRWEHDLFEREFLARHDPGADRRAIRRELKRIGDALLDTPSGLIHRDLQSTNLLWHRGGPVLIDYQGMRRGPLAYDLASLLADPYVHRSFDAQLTLLAAYNRRADTPVSETACRSGAVQRLCQALGAYGRLGALPGMQAFLGHVPAAAAQLRDWAPPGAVRDWAVSFSERQAPGIPL